MKVKMLTSAVIGLPSGQSISAPSGKVMEIDDATARSIIRGKLAIETDEEIERENQPMAGDPTHEKIEQLIKEQPIFIKRKKAVTQTKKTQYTNKKK